MSKEVRRRLNRLETRPIEAAFSEGACERLATYLAKKPLPLEDKMLSMEELRRLSTGEGVPAKLARAILEARQ